MVLLLLLLLCLCLCLWCSHLRALASLPPGPVVSYRARPSTPTSNNAMQLFSTWLLECDVS